MTIYFDKPGSILAVCSDPSTQLFNLMTEKGKYKAHPNTSLDNYKLMLWTHDAS
jgi:hypothetical protein